MGQWDKWTRHEAWDPGGAAPVFTVAGTITDWEGNPLSGVLVTLTGGYTDTTDVTGTYLIEDVPVGSYTLTPTKAGVTFNPTSRAVNIVDANISGQDFAEQVYAVSGNVTDWQSAALASVTITVTGDKSTSTTTDGSGNYSINLPNGNYTLTPSKTGYEFSPASDTAAVSGAAVGSKDFAQATHTLSGTVSGDVASGVTITLTGDVSDSTTTAGDGTYSFTLPNGDYNVEPSLEGYTFSPTDTDVTIAGGNQTGKDFTAASTTVSLPWVLDWEDNPSVSYGTDYIDLTGGPGTAIAVEATETINGYDPSTDGYDYQFKHGPASGGNPYYDHILDYREWENDGLTIDLSAGLRFQAMFGNNPSSAWMFQHFWVYEADGGGNVNNGLYIFFHPTGAGDERRIQYIIGGSATTVYYAQAAPNCPQTGNTWMNLAFEFPANGNGTFQMYTGSYGTGAHSAGPYGAAINIDVSGWNLNRLRVDSRSRYDSGWRLHNYWWLGTLSDSFPEWPV